jgi:hypothetical protein
MPRPTGENGVNSSFIHLICQKVQGKKHSAKLFHANCETRTALGNYFRKFGIASTVGGMDGGLRTPFSGRSS